MYGVFGRVVADEKKDIEFRLRDGLGGHVDHHTDNKFWAGDRWSPVCPEQ
jgi:hypothetical protein